MSNQSFVLELPSDLLEKANAAQLDLRQLLIHAVEENLSLMEDDIAQILNQRLPADQVKSALESIRIGERVFGLHAGTIWMSDDFDDPLPDEFWLGSDT